MCQHLHCLPSPGGLLDQDSFLVYGMDLVVEAQETRRKLEDAQRDATARTQGKAPRMA